MRLRIRWERVALVALLGGALWWGGRAVRSSADSTRPFQHANREAMFRYGLFTLYGSTHADFLYRAHALVGRSRVLLLMPHECPSSEGPIATTDGWSLVYSLLPATVTCDARSADYELAFNRIDPAPPGPPIAADDIAHALYRLRR